ETPYDAEWVFEWSAPGPMTYDTSDLFFTVDAGPTFHDPDLYEFNEYATGGQNILEEVTAFQLDLERDLMVGERATTIKFGAKRVSRDKRSDQDLEVFDGFADDLLLTGFTEAGKDDFYSSEREYEFGPRMNWPSLEAFFNANAGGFEQNPADTIAETFGVDFDVS